jgi:hypothetical protein
LRHILLVRDLPSDGSVLDWSRILAEPVTPLRAALRGCLLGPRSGVVTFVLQTPDSAGLQQWLGRGHRTSLRGFAQARAQPAGAAWTVVHMAPPLDGSEESATVWYRLLLHLCIAAGEKGVLRLFARLPVDSPAEEVFRQASFAVYARERVFARSLADRIGALSPDLHPVGCEGLAEVQRLYYRVTPRLVLQVEEPNEFHPEAESSETRASGAPDRQGFALYSRSGEIQGYVCTLSGPRGAWLRVMVHPDAQERTGDMLDHALAATSDRAPRPLYCAVREYQGGIQALLEERGFALVSTDSLLVKHTTVRVQAPVRNLVQVLEKRAEITPTVSHSEANPLAPVCISCNLHPYEVPKK